MLNPIFWKKVQGQKHPGRWGIEEHQIPSVKVLFKTIVKSHKHPGIKLLTDIEQDLLRPLASPDHNELSNTMCIVVSDAICDIKLALLIQNRVTKF